MSSRNKSPAKRVTFADTQGSSLARTETNNEPVVSAPQGSNPYGLSGYKATTFGPSTKEYITKEEQALAHGAEIQKNLRLFTNKMYDEEFKRLSYNYERENPKRIDELYDDFLSRKEEYVIQQLGDIDKFFERYQDALNDPEEKDKIWFDNLNKRYKNTTLDICTIAKDCARVALGIFLGYMGYRYFQGGKTKKKRRSIKRTNKKKGRTKKGKRR